MGKYNARKPLPLTKEQEKILKPLIEQGAVPFASIKNGKYNLEIKRPPRAARRIINRKSEEDRGERDRN